MLAWGFFFAGKDKYILPGIGNERDVRFEVSGLAFHVNFLYLVHDCQQRLLKESDTKHQYRFEFSYMKKALLLFFTFIALIGTSDISKAQGKCSLSCRLFYRSVIESAPLEGTNLMLPSSVYDMPGNAKVSLIHGKDTLSVKENNNLDDFVCEGLESGEYTLLIEVSNKAPRELFFEISEGENALLVDLQDIHEEDSDQPLGLKGATLEGNLFTYDAVDFGIQMKSQTLLLLANLPISKVENKKLIVDIGDIQTTLMEGAMLFSLGDLTR